MYQVTIPITGVWTFSLCGSQFDTYLYLGTSCCASELGADDDYGGCSPQSTLTGWIPAGTYYARVEGHAGDPPDWCGEYTLSVFQCQVPCPPDGAPENEPECQLDYDDSTNGGCNWIPEKFWPIALGESVCGTSGTYPHQDPSVPGLYYWYRDTDWYELTIGEPTAFTWTVTAEFPVRTLIIDGTCGCALRHTLASLSTNPCTPGTLQTDCRPPGRYWFWVGPATFSGVPCGLRYTATLTSQSCAPAQAGDLCSNALPVPALPFDATGSTCGLLDNYDAPCLSSGSAPDVVYAYTAPSDQHIAIDLCDSSFGATLYVYADVCCNPPIACADNLAICPNGASRLKCLSVLAGHTYYIVVDGDDAACGDYVLHVASVAPKIVDCPLHRTLPTDADCRALLPDLTAEVVAVDDCDGDLTVTQNPPAGTPAGPGATVVTITATNARGLADACQTAITVQDALPPRILTCASERTVSADPNDWAVVPDLRAEVAATDNCPGLTIMQNPPAGTLVGLGATLVTLTVTDAAGGADTCQVPITVVPQRLTLTADNDCYDVGDLVSVEVWMVNVYTPVVGGQFFLGYDEAKLQLVSADPAGDAAAPFDANNPFDIELYECSMAVGAPFPPCIQTPGQIDYAVAKRFQSPLFVGATGTVRMAVLVFRARTPICSEVNLVKWQPHDPPTVLSDAEGGALTPRTTNLDVEDPAAPWIECPPDTTVEISEPRDPPYTGRATATDNCAVALLITYADTLYVTGCDGTGTISRTWTAADFCGHSSDCTQTITLVNTATPPISPADFDNDCDVDFADFLVFSACLAGPAVTTAPPGCDPSNFARADFDHDDDVDLYDFAVFQIHCTAP